MKIVSIGGGPAGLYSALLLKKQDPSREVRVVERNKSDDTFGFGVVFSDATLDGFKDIDPESYEAITSALAHWDDIDIHYQGQVIRSTGHGFSGLSRMTLLSILQDRCRDVGVELDFETEVEGLEAYSDADLILAADGVNSRIRDEKPGRFEEQLDWRPNRFVWLGTSFPFEAFTFYFKSNAHGMFRVHAYRYEEGKSTFIVECTEDTWRAAGLDDVSEDDTVRYMEELFKEELKGHPLLKNRSNWRQFPTIHCGRWHHENVVLLGDAVHTAHFSIGSGTKLAMEDAIALRDALTPGAKLGSALARYEAERRPPVESLQRAAQVSLEWFENTERYMHLPPLQFAFSLLTRSMRVTHENLALRDPDFVGRLDTWFEKSSAKALDLPAPDHPERPTPPAFTPYKLRDMELQNRIVVSPMCQYSATDGEVNDWHLVHLGSRAVGGAGLIITEMTDVSADARISPGCAGMYDPKHVTAWRRVVDFVHANSGAKIGIQLAHAGRKGATKVLWEGYDEPLEQGAWPIISASDTPYFAHSQVPKPMDRGDMDRVKADFVRATEMSEAAGFDMIELHMAHGYLLASFLSPVTNRRADEYGGSLENRMRYPLEVLDAVRAAWPKHKPMSVRISATDWMPDGNAAEDAVEIARALKAHDVDIIDVSAGQTDPKSKPEYGRLFQTPFSEQIRMQAEVPTMTVGAISSYEDTNSIIASGRADLCVLARAHLWNPYWSRHAAYELGHEMEWPNQYKAISRYTPRFSSKK